MNQIESKFETVAISSLKEYPGNPNNGKLPEIVQSIRRNGFYGAAIVQKSTGYILVGNHRVAGAAAAGMTEVPVLYVDVDDRTALRILLADNQTNRRGTFDSSELDAILRSMISDDSKLEGIGLSSKEVERVLGRILPQGDAPIEEMLDIWGVIIACDNQEQQKQLYAEFTQRNFDCKEMIDG